MKRILFSAILLLLPYVVVPAATANVLTLTPNKVTLFDADGSGVSRIGMSFEFSALPAGEGRRIDEAWLEWRLSGVPANHGSQYFAHPITASWTLESRQAPPASVEASAHWFIEPLDYERNSGGFVRLDLTELTTGWTIGTIGNYGVMLVTDDVSRINLAQQLDGITLTLRYGFMKP